MKSNVIIGLIILSVLIFVLNGCVPTEKCGNGIVDEGETYESCCLDVACPDNFECVSINKTDLCKEKTYLVSLIKETGDLSEKTLSLSDLIGDKYSIFPEGTGKISKETVSEKLLQKGWLNGYSSYFGSETSNRLVSSGINIYNDIDQMGKAEKSRYSEIDRDFDITILNEPLGVGEDTSIVFMTYEESANIYGIQAAFTIKNAYVVIIIRYIPELGAPSSQTLLEEVKQYSENILNKLQNQITKNTIPVTKKLCADGKLIDKTNECKTFEFEEEAFELATMKDNIIVKEYSLINPTRKHFCSKVLGIIKNKGSNTISDYMLYIKILDAQGNMIDLKKELFYHIDLKSNEEMPFETDLCPFKKVEDIELSLKVEKGYS